MVGAERGCRHADVAGHVSYFRSWPSSTGWLTGSAAAARRNRRDLLTGGQVSQPQHGLTAIMPTRPQAVTVVIGFARSVVAWYALPPVAGTAPFRMPHLEFGLPA